MYAAGRAETVLNWFDWVDARGAVERHPAVAALAAYVCALTGRAAAADRWADLAERWSGQRRRNDADPVTAMWLTTVRGPTTLVFEEERPVELRHLYLAGDRD